MSSSSSPTPSSAESIQRVLFLSPTVHIYTVPPLTSTKGYTTTSWSPLLSPPSPSSSSSSKPEPITTRLRVLETSTPSLPKHDTQSSTAGEEDEESEEQEEPHITCTILLEDSSTSALFAEAPYTSPSVVSPVLDSARFFAIRVEAEGGRMKAVLGIGFEERSEAGDFVDCLRRVGRVMGWERSDGGGGGHGNGEMKGGGRGRTGKGVGEGGKETVKDWSLKEGEMIRVEINGVGDGARGKKEIDGDERRDGEALFSIKPPLGGGRDGGGGGGLPFLPPPPSASEIKAERRRSRGRVEPEKGSAAELGFDDGEFGEFQ